jgi:hypothetical protein
VAKDVTETTFSGNSPVKTYKTIADSALSHSVCHCRKQGSDRAPFRVLIIKWIFCVHQHAKAAVQQANCPHQSFNRGPSTSRHTFRVTALPRSQPVAVFFLIQRNESKVVFRKCMKVLCRKQVYTFAFVCASDDVTAIILFIQSISIKKISSGDLILLDGGSLNSPWLLRSRIDPPSQALRRYCYVINTTVDVLSLTLLAQVLSFYPLTCLLILKAC